MRRIINQTKNILLSYLVVFSFSTLQAECSPTIEEVFFNEDIIGYYLSAIDIQSGESNVLLFDYAIDLSTCDDIGLLDVDFSINMYIPSFSSYSSGPNLLASGTVNLTDIPPELAQLQLRNTDLSFDTKYLQGGTKFNLTNYSQGISESEIEELTEIIMGQGRVPNGVYYFSFTLKGAANTEYEGQEFDFIQKEIDIYVPTYLELVSPGSVSSSQLDNNLVFTTSPVFQWNTDYCSLCEYSIRVCEYRADDHVSLQEAIEDVSILPMESGFYSVNTSNVFQYPSTGVEPLNAGDSYVWQIKRSFETTNGINEEYSEIFIFKIQSFDSSPIIVEDTNLENLKLFIGESRYNELFGQNGDLMNYNTVNSTLMINNEQKSINYLLDLIEMSNSGEINIIEIQVE